MISDGIFNERLKKN